MGHVPHVLVDGPWDAETLSVTDNHHLTRVLRTRPGDPVTYTDGKGVLGRGHLADSSSIVRGSEETIARRMLLDVAVAPPSSKDRTRFLVEKLGELGVNRVIWLRTAHGTNRVPSPTKSHAWARSALEQSRGAWLMDVAGDLSSWPALEGPIVACDPGESDQPDPQPRTVAIGPEGGWRASEIPEDIPRWHLLPTVLRVETAAIVAASLVLGGKMK